MQAKTKHEPSRTIPCLRVLYIEGSAAGLLISYKLGPRWDDVITWSDFKSETNFGFPKENYTGMLLGFSCKTSKYARLTSHCVLVFSRGL